MATAAQPQQPQQNTSTCSSKITSETSTMPCNSSNIKMTSSNSNVVPIERYNNVLARLDLEVRARQHAESQLTEARSRVHFLQRQLPTLSSSTAATNHQLYHPVVVNPSHALLSTKNVIDSCNSNNDSTQVQPIPQQQQQQHSQPQGQKQEQKPQTPETEQKQQKSQPQEKEILSHCSDISNCNKLSSNNGNGSAGGGTCNSNSNNNNHQTIQSTTKKLTSTNNNSGISKKSKSKKERPVKVKIPGQSRYWTPEEHKLFLEALQKYGHKDLRSISNYVGTRNMTQVRTHSQKYFMRLMREAKRQNPGSKNITDSSNNNANENITATNTNNAKNIPLKHQQITTDTKIHNISSCSNNSNVSNPMNTNKSIVSKVAVDESDKYSVPNTCGMTLLCLVGEDTRV